MVEHRHPSVLLAPTRVADPPRIAGSAFPGLAEPFSADARVRLALTYGTPRGPVDGAWWPRSADPSAEIALLVAAVSDAYSGRVLTVVYDRTRWLPVPRRTLSERLAHDRLSRDPRSGDRLPRHQAQLNAGRLRSGRPLTDPDLITLVMLNGVQVVLLVVPPDFAEDQAMWAAKRACQLHNTLSPFEILREAPAATFDHGPQHQARDHDDAPTGVDQPSR